MTKDMILDKDTPFFATSDAPLALIKGGTIDEINTEMMQVRWNMFRLHRQIPKNEQKDIKPCISCFGKLITSNANAHQIYVR